MMAHTKHHSDIGIGTNFYPLGVKAFRDIGILRVDRDKFNTGFFIFFKIRVISAICDLVINLNAFKQIRSPQNIDFCIFEYDIMRRLKRINLQIAHNGRIYLACGSIAIFAVGTDRPSKYRIKKPPCDGSAIMKQPRMSPPAIACVIYLFGFYVF